MSFDDQVYAVLQSIPVGKVATYADIAAAVGNPRAARAVGNALNRNPNAPRVPCHRVVRSDGSLGGYAFGAQKKSALLGKEGVRVSGDRVDLNTYRVHSLKRVTERTKHRRSFCERA